MAEGLSQENTAPYCELKFFILNSIQCNVLPVYTKDKIKPINEIVTFVLGSLMFAKQKHLAKRSLRRFARFAQNFFKAKKVKRNLASRSQRSGLFQMLLGELNVHQRK